MSAGIFGRASRARGLTLVEMMVVVLVIAVLLTLAVPAFNNLLARQRLSAAASELVNNLQLARSEALQRKVNVGMSISSAGRCYVSFERQATPSCDCTTGRCGMGAGAPKVNNTKITPSWSLDLSSNVVDFGFLADRGQLSTSVPISIVLSHASVGRVETTVGLSGLVSACSPGGAVPGIAPC